MINLVILVFVGGAFGAMFREFVMLMVPHMADGFPLDIFVANVVASFLLGLSTTLHQRVKPHHHVHTMIGTGIMGGLSTFSSFVWGAVTVMRQPGHFWISVFYLIASLLVGFLMVEAGLKLARKTAA